MTTEEGIEMILSGLRIRGLSEAADEPSADDVKKIAGMLGPVEILGLHRMSDFLNRMLEIVRARAH